MAMFAKVGRCSYVGRREGRRREKCVNKISKEVLR